MKLRQFILLCCFGLCLVACSDPCEGVDCGPGVCIDGDCDCPEGFLGTNCEIKDPCFDVNCNDNGDCVDGTCACDVGYEGEFCADAIRDKYLGIWAFTDFECNVDGVESAQFFFEQGESITDLILSDLDSPYIQIPVKVTGQTTFEIPEYSYINNSIQITIDGSGTLVDDLISMTYNISADGLEISCFGTGTK